MNDVITNAEVTKHDADYVRRLEERITVLQGQLDAWTGRFARDAQALQDRIVELQREANDAWFAYAKVNQENERLKAVLHQVRPRTYAPVHHDNLGPIFKDDLDAQALRDGRLERSAESRQRITAKHADSGEAGIEFGPDECRRPNCPTKQPHRHLVHSPGIATSTNNAMHPLDDPLSQQAMRIKATLDDSPDNDVTPVKANPRHVKTVADYAKEKFERGRQDVKEPTAFQDFVSSLPDETLDHSKPMDVNNIVGGPNEAQLSRERREFAEQMAANTINQAFSAGVLSDPKFQEAQKQTTADLRKLVDGDPVGTNSPIEDARPQDPVLGAMLDIGLSEASDETTNHPDNGGTDER